MFLGNLFFKINAYLKFLTRFTIPSIICFLIDTFVFVYLRSIVGTNKALFLSFIISQTSLFSILRLVLTKKYKKNYNGLTIQILIGVVSLFIHFSILNIVDYIVLENFPIFYYDIFLNSKFISFFMKFICGFFGFFSSSILTRKFLFKLKR